MKKAYWTNLRRTLVKSKVRFLSIFGIVFLGAAVFAGLRCTPTTMMKSMDVYLDQYDYADLTYLSSLGFSNDDIDSIKGIESIDKLSYGYQFDAQLLLNESKLGVQVYSSEEYNENMLNSVELLEGRLPIKHNECLVDKELYESYENIKLDEYITIKNDNGKKAFKVVGIINDTRFISKMQRGTVSIGDGKCYGYIQILNDQNAFLALPDALYELRGEEVLYNSISVGVKGAQDYNLFTDEYDDYISDTNIKIKSTLSNRLSRLYDDLTSDAKEALEEPLAQYNQGLEEYETNSEAFEKQILEAKIQLTEAKITLASKEEEYLNGQGQLNEATSSISSVLSDKLDELNELLEKLKNKELEIEYDASKKITLEDVNEAFEKIMISIDGLSQTLDAMNTMNDASLQISKAKLEIEKQENKLNLLEYETTLKLNDAKKQLDEAAVLIEEAQQAIDAIPKGKLYTLTRNENIGLVSFDANRDSIQSIAEVFPFIFFLVSALVSLTTMTRLVEEQRSQNGVLRALGYSKLDVINQYVIYSFVSTFFASLLGIIAGIQIFPRIVYFLYHYMMFTIGADTVIDWSITISVQTVVISVFVTLFATLSVCIKELGLMPAVLMRPKAPKVGKRILLERIKWIWSRLSFNHKVTMRNIFRYKKRFFMSILGIAGCTALIITGFGIKHSVSQIVPLQYETIFTFDASLALEEVIQSNESDDYKNKLLKRDEVNNVEYIYNQSISILKNKEELVGYMVVYQSSDNIRNFIRFEDYKSKDLITIEDDGVILSQKTAEMLGVEVNDSIDIELNEEKYNVKVSGIMTNYYLNYVYMSENLYEELTDDRLVLNSAYIIMKNDTTTYQKTLTSYLEENKLGTVTYMDEMGKDFYSQIDSVDMVTVLLIVCAGALNFIVLYNLTNINIQERKSEIATIKVLGFRRKEVYDYIFRENIILSLIGSLVGIVLGIILHQFIIRTVELDMTMFVRTIDPISILYAIAMTIGFTLLINLSMRHVLRKVNMVESLKSIE